ncbi:hypothetical protein Syun_002401 [Stephania yunnanensis]|uniref:MD-2-related lipid-recognition domain-containing protein n=1 Tax=Stephania yunnanensis TaxID=152371 RepID=A0AAP0QBT1_9MAGN
MDLNQFKIACCLIFAALLAQSIDATNVKYCGKESNYPVKVSAVDISPDPVVRGKPATFSIAASSGEISFFVGLEFSIGIEVSYIPNAEQPIRGGHLIIDVAFFGFHVHSEKKDICVETTCPVEGGDFVIAHTQDLPAFTPPVVDCFALVLGSYTLKMKMVGEHGEQLTCITFNFQIVFSSGVADS